MRRLAQALDTSQISWEIIVVDDGGNDIASEDFADLTRVQILRFPENRGKGAAVRGGMLAATGEVRVFTDVDLPYDLDLIPTIATIIRERGFHMVIGDRSLPTSRYASELNLGRRLASKIFTGFVGTLVTGGFFDTQCGLKGLRGDVANEIFRLAQIDRFAFDVELVYLALKHKLDVHRIPVQLRSNETSSVKLLRDASRGVIDVLRIKLNQIRGLYASPSLANLIQREFDDIRSETRSRQRRHSANAEIA